MFLQLVVKKQSKTKQKKQLTNLNRFMSGKELCNQLAIKKQNKAKQKRKEKKLKTEYSSKSRHVETKKQTKSSCKNNGSSNNNHNKTFNDRKDTMTGKERDFHLNKKLVRYICKKIFY